MNKQFKKNKNVKIKKYFFIEKNKKVVNKKLKYLYQNNSNTPEK